MELVIWGILLILNLSYVFLNSCTLGGDYGLII